jgi:membrane protein DedA with SNARE-associated domain
VRDQQRVLVVLARLAQMNRTTVFLGALAVAVAGFLLPAALGALLLYGLVVGLGAVLARTWPVTPAGMRTVRLLMLAGLAAAATTKLL